MYIDDIENNLECKKKLKKPEAEGKYEELAVRFLEAEHAVHRQGVDYVWSGTHYRQVPDLVPYIRRWLLSEGIPQTSVLVGNVAAIIRAKMEIDPIKYPVVPCWVGGMIGPANAVIFENCVYDLDTGGTHKHSRNFFSPFCLPYKFDPDAECSTWHAFLADSLDGDAERIALLQEWAGYLLSGDTSQQKYLVCVGPGNCGKGTIAEVLLGLVGHENATGFDLRQLCSRFGASALVSKRLAIVDEVELTGEKNKAAIVESFKKITGEGFVDVEYKGVNARPSLKLPTRFHVSCNSMPDLKDPTGALGRRQMILPFFNGKSEAERDTGLKGKLLAELPGICQWALAGLKRLRSQGRFTVPAAAKPLIAASKVDGSPVLAFLEENCAVEGKYRPGNLSGIKGTDKAGGVWRHDLYSRASKWYELNGKQFDAVWFARDLRDLLPLVKFDRVKRSEGKQLPYVTELELLPERPPEVVE